MSGWYMWHPERFRLHPLINPLFISIHISPSIADRMLTIGVIEYLKKHEPIGARDSGTQQLLEKHGIKSYLSGCLTLTLGLSYSSTKKNDNVCFVDPYFEWGGGETKGKCFQYLRGLIDAMLYRKQVAHLLDKFKGGYHHPKIEQKCPRLGKKIMAAAFYKTYSTLFEDDILFNASYITHNVACEECNNEEEWLQYARDLLQTYSQTKLTITSRIHCALPCLGMQTPTIFVCSAILETNSVSGRYGGLTDLMNIVYQDNGKLVPSRLNAVLNSNQKIGNDTVVSNSTDWMKFRDTLIETVTSFLHPQRPIS